MTVDDHINQAYMYAIILAMFTIYHFIGLSPVVGGMIAGILFNALSIAQKSR